VVKTRFRARDERHMTVPPVGAYDRSDHGQSTPSFFDALCRKKGMRHDPCVIDLFMSVVHFIDGGEPLPWWHFTAERKRMLAGR
jgi:hypothetical protein